MAQTQASALSALLDRLKTAQRDLLLTTAQSQSLPSDGTIRKISEMEGAIAATEALLDELRDKR
ncbi:MAG: hypothetical protein B7X99_19485 [Rhizobiales bacterium 17-65-6]|jgi:hypothetical protein|nr:MAG: hypothetical protein B7Z30_00200 [Rhizobiales bacterium 12-68-15]OYX89676.1 MAG: hypothetical protein B7Y84_04150 [Azorhizobium sp. 32-67-21]OYY08532.1 MAG: hypothetical protein B7Y70_12000 [Rhizobiales bacterium 35-68-8]OYZ89487.1 MAG: hypothetical protein B7X99_19485 [Rhizobiales bacterium 17-65-6]